MNKDRLYDEIDKDDELADAEKREIYFSEIARMEEEEHFNEQEGE